MCRKLGLSGVLILSIVLLTLPMAFAQTGNGAPSGPHYNLNIIGHTQCPGDDLVDSNRHTIMVLLNFSDGDNSGQLASTLDKRNKIFLSEGDFRVLDGNACDGDGARFQLPANPFGGDLDDPTFQEYTVWARALGKPGGSATITTCAVDTLGTADPSDDVIVCSTESVVLVRTTGKSTFKNYTKELTTICLVEDATGKCTSRVGIFDPSLYGYFWDYDNSGLRLAQLRFYPIPD